MGQLHIMGVRFLHNGGCDTDTLDSEAGNLALKILSTGIIYLVGGISPRIITSLEKPEFLEALRSKGRFRELLTDMPIHVIMNPKAGLFGAAAFGLTASVPCK